MLPEIYVLKPIVEKKRSYCFHEHYGIYFLDRPLIRNTYVFPLNTIHQQNQRNLLIWQIVNDFFWWLSDENPIKLQFNVM